jgi:hypothetical protein
MPGRDAVLGNGATGGTVRKLCGLLVRFGFESCHGSPPPPAVPQRAPASASHPAGRLRAAGPEQEATVEPAPPLQWAELLRQMGPGPASSSPAPLTADEQAGIRQSLLKDDELKELLVACIAFNEAREGDTSLAALPWA